MMDKLIIIALALICSFSCAHKSIYMTNKELKETFKRVDSLTLNEVSYSTEDSTIDTSLLSPSNKLSIWGNTLDTADVIIKYVFNWEEGEIETLTGKAVYPICKYGIWLGVTGQDSKLFKVKDGVWIPIEWPKHIVELYIRPKN